MSNTTSRNDNDSTEGSVERGNIFIGPEFVLVIGIIGLAANELYKLAVKFL